MNTSVILNTKPLNTKEMEEIAERIRARIRRTITEIIETGRDLTEAKAQLEHGHFIDWLWNEFSMSARTAQNYMRAAEWAEGKNEIVSHLSPTAVYALAAPSTPASVTDRVIADAKAGKPVNDEYVKRHIKVAIEEERERKRHQREASVRAVLAAVSATPVAEPPTEHEDSGRIVEELPPETTYAAEPERPLTKPRKPTKAQLEIQNLKAEQARKHAEAVAILRKLERSDIERLIELQCWPCFEDSEAWMWLWIEFDPDPPRQTEPGELLDCYGLDDTEENRRRLKQLNQGDVEALAVEPHDPDEDPSARPLGPDEELPASAAAGLGPVNQDDDDLLVIPAVFKRGRTA